MSDAQQALTQIAALAREAAGSTQPRTGMALLRIAEIAEDGRPDHVGYRVANPTEAEIRRCPTRRGRDK
jgi:hypothetical protein